MEGKGIRAVISAALAAFAAYFGAIVVPLLVLAVMMIADYISGMAAAYMSGSLSSRAGIRGIVKKVSYMLLIGVAMGLDYLIMSGLTAVSVQVGLNMWFGLLVTVWLIINEMISILENLSRLGVPIPKFLTAIVKKLKVSADGKDEGND